MIRGLEAVCPVHYGLVIYRDRGVEHTTRLYDSVSDVDEFQSQLSQVEAAGGVATVRQVDFPGSQRSASSRLYQ